MILELLPTDPASAGPYRLVGRLGAGGMGRVYLARSPGGRQVAVKVIRPELADEPGFRVRFAREVAAARNVGGIFTAPVVDADTDGPVPWLATAYVPGPSLAEAVAQRGPLPADAVRGLGAGLAEGLQAIHAAGLVHRDLKPSNVLLARDGPRVIDFGISRALEATTLTAGGSLMGSPGFLSPEQAKPGQEVGQPSDVFSLGAVLVYAACGVGPYGVGPAAALLYRVVNEEPDLTGVPGELRPVIARCLAKDPAARPTTAQLLAELGGDEVATGWRPYGDQGAFEGYQDIEQQAAEPDWLSEAAVPLLSFPGDPTELSAPPVPEPTVAPDSPSGRDLDQWDGEQAPDDLVDLPAAGLPGLPGLPGIPGLPDLPVRPSPRRRRAAVSAVAVAALAAAAVTVALLLPGGSGSRSPLAASDGATPSLVATSGSAPASTAVTRASQRPVRRSTRSATAKASTAGPAAQPAASQTTTAPVTTPTSRQPTGQPTHSKAPTPPAPPPQGIGSYSGATEYACGAAPAASSGAAAAFQLVNDSSATVDVDGQPIPAGGTSAVGGAVGAVLTVQGASGCLGVFKQTGSGQIVVV
jgi:eukaryotic-like serine/threonine-protein kinase